MVGVLIVLFLWLWNRFTYGVIKKEEVWFRIVRIDVGLNLLTPWSPPLFSERMCIKFPIVSVAGWRLFPLWPIDRERGIPRQFRGWNW